MTPGGCYIRWKGVAATLFPDRPRVTDQRVRTRLQQIKKSRAAFTQSGYVRSPRPPPPYTRRAPLPLSRDHRLGQKRLSPQRTLTSDPPGDEIRSAGARADRISSDELG